MLWCISYQCTPIYCGILMLSTLFITPWTTITDHNNQPREDPSSSLASNPYITVTCQFTCDHPPPPFLLTSCEKTGSFLSNNYNNTTFSISYPQLKVYLLPIERLEKIVSCRLLPYFQKKKFTAAGLEEERVHASHCSTIPSPEEKKQIESNPYSWLYIGYLLSL